jgi:hypothetical protein
MKKQLLTLLSLALATTLSAQIPNYVPTNGLVGWWPFNGNANDESGNGNNGTVNGANLTADRFGNVNKAYSFDGVDDFISTSFSPPLFNNSRSFSFWIKHSLSLNSQIFTYGSFLPSYSSFRLGVNENFGGCQGISFNVSDGQITKYQVTNDNQWHNVVLTMNTGDNLHDVKIYFDGILLNSLYCSDYAGSTPVNTISQQTLRIGTDIFLNQFYNGSLDDIGIWNRALTACEVQHLYNAELNSANVSAGPDQELCEGQSTSLFGTGASTYQWSNNVQNGVGFLPTVTNSYILTGTDANGCVGTDTVTVTVNEISSSVQTQSALDSYTWPVNGQTYTQSGQYTDTLLNAAGCDSIVALDLTLSFTGIDEINSNPTKKLLKITDLNGKETTLRKNTVLLFIYEDGTVERIFEAE